MTAPGADAGTAVTPPGWLRSSDGLHTVLHAPSAGAAVALVTAIGEAANAADHHPDLDWRYDHVFLRLTTHSAGGAVTDADLALAATITTLAERADARHRTELVWSLEIAVDTADPDAVADVWQRALRYRRAQDGSLTDPWGRGPTVWFQRTTTPNPNRLHLDVYGDDTRAPDLVDAVVEAGGTLDTAAHAPSFWVLVDADGNRFCVCTDAADPVDSTEPPSSATPPS